MFKKRLATFLLSALMLIGTLSFTQISANAATSNGWQQNGSKWNYYQNGAMVKNGWQKDSKGWCFLSAVDGSWVQEGWANDSHGWGYIRNGYWVEHSTWAKDSKGWLYISANGYWDSSVAPKATKPADDILYFPQLSTVPMPTNASYSRTETTPSSDGSTVISYYYSCALYPASLVDDYASLLTNNGWVFYKNDYLDSNTPTVSYIKGNHIVLICVIGSDFVIFGDIH